MLKRQFSLIALASAFTLPVYAETSSAPVAASVPQASSQEKNPPYGDNPNIFRVVTYKTGQGISRIGDSIQRGAEKSSTKMSEKWEDSKEYRAEQTQAAQDKALKAKEYTSQKLQQTRDAVIGTNGGTVPIEQGTLSQPTSNQVNPAVTTSPDLAVPAASPAITQPSANP